MDKTLVRYWLGIWVRATVGVWAVVRDVVNVRVGIEVRVRASRVRVGVWVWDRDCL